MRSPPSPITPLPPTRIDTHAASARIHMTVFTARQRPAGRRRTAAVQLRPGLRIALPFVSGYYGLSHEATVTEQTATPEQKSTATTPPLVVSVTPSIAVAKVALLGAENLAPTSTTRLVRQPSPCTRRLKRRKQMTPDLSKRCFDTSAHRTKRSHGAVALRSQRRRGCRIQQETALRLPSKSDTRRGS